MENDGPCLVSPYFLFETYSPDGSSCLSAVTWPFSSTNSTFLLIIAITIALGENQFVVNDYADADARSVPVLQRLFHKRVKPRKLLGNFRALVLSVNRNGED